MAAKVRSADSSEQVITSRRKESINEVFIPKDTLDRPCDVVLMVKDGKEFKAHRRVLTEASPFFEKLLSSDMKETQEGVVLLEMFTESVMAATLQFIYTGDVQILADQDNARDLIVVADYLFLDKLKCLAGGVLVQMLNTSNCISTFYFAERYQCRDLLSNTRKFLVANFSSIYAASRDDVLNMSSREVEMCISSDEIEVSAEEDVFKIILAWIDHDSRRKKYFVELFRHVRLVYVSRDVLRKDIETNELVRDNNSCLKLVKDAINLVDSQNCYSLSVPPRKSLEIPVIVINVAENVLCYFPRENSWCKLGEIPPEYITYGKFFPCGGQLYRTVQESSNFIPQSLKQITYNPYSNSCIQLPSLEEPGRYFREIFVRNGNEMYALMSEPCVMGHLRTWRVRDGRRTGRRFFRVVGQNCESRKHTSFLTKYRPESNSWEDVTSFDHLDQREHVCIVTNDNFIYFIGGIEWPGNECTFLSDVDRYDMTKNQWDKLADIQMARKWAHGAAVNEKIYIAGGVFRGSWLPESCQCEVYDETTNEWQFIRSFLFEERKIETLLAVDGELYGLSSVGYFEDRSIRIDYYNPKKNKWTCKTRLEILRKEVSARHTIMCSMRIFKGLFNIRPMVEAFPVGTFSGATTTQPSVYLPKASERKCFIM